MIEFVLNSKHIKTQVRAGITLLDFIRSHELLKGTKIGCREGDCGACTVLVGSIENNKLTYKSITSCISPLGNAHGKHIVTVEGINLPDKLNTIQTILKDYNATQCGFCTPGFVMSLVSLCMQTNLISKTEALKAISGNICRCTGYKSIERAAYDIYNKVVALPFTDRLQTLVEEAYIPAYFLKITDKNRRVIIQMAKIIAIANQKGGVGKTSTAINLSASIAASEKRTLLIDIDPQANSTSGLGIEGKDNSIYQVLIGIEEASESIVNTYMPFLDLLPSDINLVGAEIEIVSLKNRETLLKSSIISIINNYDFVFIDCPPSLGLLTLNALTAADSVIVPVQCEYFALEGLGQLLNTINIVKKYFNPNLTIEGVLLTMFDRRLRLSQQVVDEVKKYFGEKVFNTIIHRNVRISEAPSHSKPVILYDAISTGARDYMALADEIINKHYPSFEEKKQ